MTNTNGSDPRSNGTVPCFSTWNFGTPFCFQFRYPVPVPALGPISSLGFTFLTQAPAPVSNSGTQSQFQYLAPVPVLDSGHQPNLLPLLPAPAPSPVSSLGFSPPTQLPFPAFSFDHQFRHPIRYSVYMTQSNAQPQFPIQHPIQYPASYPAQYVETTAMRTCSNHPNGPPLSSSISSHSKTPSTRGRNPNLPQPISESRTF